MATAFLFPPMYSIEGKLIVKSKQIQPPPESTDGDRYHVSVLPPTQQDVISEVEIITSNDLIHQSIQHLVDHDRSIIPRQSLFGGLLNDYIISPLTNWFIHPVKDYIVSPVMQWLGLQSVEKPLTEVEQRAREIKEIISGQVLPGSNIIRVSFVYGDPELGADILNAVFDNYLSYRLSLFTNPSKDRFFYGQINKLQEEMQSIQNQKLDILRAIDSSDPEKDMDVQMSLAEKLQRDIQTLQRDQVEQNQIVNDLKRLYKNYLNNNQQLFRAFPYDFKDTEIDRYAAKLIDLVFEYHKTLRVFRNDTMKIQILEDEIRELKAAYVFLIHGQLEHFSNELLLTQKLIDEKTKSLNQLRKRSRVLVDGDIRIQKLDDTLSLLLESYRTFNKKAEEFKIAQTSEISQISNVQVISHAAVPHEPFFPKKKTFIPIGLVLSILLSFVLGFIWDFFDHTFRTPDHVAQYLDLPIFGYIPYEKK